MQMGKNLSYNETCTIYLRARYYNPGTGRFISRNSFAGKQGDPLSLNLYTYCANNPIRYIDPSGHDAVDAASFMVNSPRPSTNNINSASDWKMVQNWDNKFNEILTSPAKVNSASDAIYRSKVTSPVTYNPQNKCDGERAVKQAAMYSAWKNLRTKVPLTEAGVSWNVPKEVVANNEAMIEKLDSKMQPLARSFLINANQSEYSLFISWGLRTNEDEAKFIDGAQNGKHTKGLAIDVEFWDSVYEGVWPCDPMEFHFSICSYGIYDENDPRWDEIGPIGKEAGLNWGGDFINKDVPHFCIYD
jgi:RHS repeat-associated protein